MVTMVDTSQVPLMMDVDDDEPSKGGVESGLGLERDFCYNNNVAGASRNVRLGMNYNFSTSCSEH